MKDNYILHTQKKKNSVALLSIFPNPSSGIEDNEIPLFTSFNLLQYRTSDSLWKYLVYLYENDNF